ncbi:MULTISPECIES: response regulator transcription factor [unclassified Streptomyces]|uniref:response regulator transcription factor n=1 Tax=unclassified Streptomyces TaxID=2593676 RepID=UPI0004C27010|nr:MULTISPECIES: helix-turn-helix transcriptional regulator [unclassified Streptomyces]
MTVNATATAPSRSPRTPARPTLHHPDRRFRSALATARHELVLVRSGETMSPVEREGERLLLLNLLRRWVRISVIWEERLAALPDVRAYVEWQARSGIQVRTSAQVPVPLSVVDNTTAVVGSFAGGGSAGRDREENTTVSDCPETVSMLHYLFLGLWDEAKPFSVSVHPSLEKGHAQEVLRMLANGSTDEQIAHRLVVSKRTVSRTVARLLDEMNARSRFEAGAIAARRGYLDATKRAF